MTRQQRAQYDAMIEKKIVTCSEALIMARRGDPLLKDKLV